MSTKPRGRKCLLRFNSSIEVSQYVPETPFHNDLVAFVDASSDISPRSDEDAVQSKEESTQGSDSDFSPYEESSACESSDEEEADMWYGLLWKLNNGVDLTDTKNMSWLRNWRLRRFMLGEYFSDEVSAKKGVISYMSEKEDALIVFNYELFGHYDVVAISDVKVECSKAEKKKIQLDNEMYEVAYGDTAGTLQSKRRKKSHIPQRLYLMKIKCYKKGISEAVIQSEVFSNCKYSPSEELILATASEEDRDMWIDQFKAYKRDTITTPVSSKSRPSSSSWCMDNIPDEGVIRQIMPKNVDDSLASRSRTPSQWRTKQ